jgi:quercetin dioxygenase-like cupin family protein
MKEPDFQEGSMRLKILSLAVLLATGSTALAEDMKAPINTSDIKFTGAPNMLPPGAQWFVLSGDPLKAGPYTIRLRLPAGYQIPAHSHSATEAITVISGKLLLGMGDKLDEKKGTLLKDGGYAEAPAKMNHYAVAKSPSVIQVHGMGPVDITYVDKADDPRNAAPR